MRHGFEKVGGFVGKSSPVGSVTLFWSDGCVCLSGWRAQMGRVLFTQDWMWAAVPDYTRGCEAPVITSHSLVCYHLLASVRLESFCRSSVWLHFHNFVQPVGAERTKLP